MSTRFAQSRRAGSGLLVWFAGVLTLIPTISLAQTAPTTTVTGAQLVARRTLLERAQVAARARDFAQALTLAQQAGAIEMTPSLRMFLAQQLHELGRHADSMENAEYCVREATHNTGLERRDIILGECRRLSALSQRQVVLVTVSVPTPHDASLSVHVGPRLVLAEEYNIPIAVDPARYEVTATATGQANHTESVDGSPGTTITVTIPARFAVSATHVNANATTSITAGTSTTNTSTNGAQNTATTATAQIVRPHVARPPTGLFARVGAGPWVLMGTGAAGFAAAGVFFALRNGQFTTCRPVGEMIVCDTDEAARQWMSGVGSPDPYTFNTLTNVSLAVGGVALLGGVVWFAVNAARSPESTRSLGQRVQRTSVQHLWIAPIGTATTLGVSLGGAL